MTDSPRSGVLQEAIGLIDGDRNAQYGPPTQDFQRTAAVLTALGYNRRDPGGLIVELEPSDVAILVMAVKLSRLMHSRGKRDNWVDLAGYAGCGFECAVDEAPAGWLAEWWSGGPQCEASGMSEAECVATDTCDCFGVGDNRLSPPDMAAEVINELTAERDHLAKEVEEFDEMYVAMRGERDLADQERAGWKQERDKVAKERDDALELLQELRDEKFLGGDQSTISNLRSQLAAFAHHAEDNKRLREENRSLADENRCVTQAHDEAREDLETTLADLGREQRERDRLDRQFTSLQTDHARVVEERNTFKRKFEHELSENMRLTRELAEYKQDPVAKRMFPVVETSYAGEPVDAADA